MPLDVIDKLTSSNIFPDPTFPWTTTATWFVNKHSYSVAELQPHWPPYKYLGISCNLPPQVICVSSLCLECSPLYPLYPGKICLPCLDLFTISLHLRELSLITLKYNTQPLHFYSSHPHIFFLSFYVHDHFFLTSLLGYNCFTMVC